MQSLPRSIGGIQSDPVLRDSKQLANSAPHHDLFKFPRSLTMSRVQMNLIGHIITFGASLETELSNRQRDKTIFLGR